MVASDSGSGTENFREGTKIFMASILSLCRKNVFYKIGIIRQAV